MRRAAWVGPCLPLAHPPCPIEGTEAFLYVRTLLASSGSTLGHGPTTRTLAFRRPPKRERGRPRHTHTHTIYAVRRVYSAGAHPVVSPPSPVSHRLASASLAVSEPTDPQPTFSSPELACASGTGVAAATVSPPFKHVADSLALQPVVTFTAAVVGQNRSNAADSRAAIEASALARVTGRLARPPALPLL
eukprot:scaffold73038_cov60-Phaeocystis_antarctica.AAC.1